MAVTKAPVRELNGERAQRIIEAMRHCVATRGIAGATFEHVAREAKVSRGLLHYYFGTKERLLNEVVRRDGEIRLAMLEATMLRANSADDLIFGLADNLQQAIRDEPDYFVLLFELFIAGRANDGVRAEFGRLYARSRAVIAEVLREKEREGVLKLRADAEDIAMYLISAGEGSALQLLSDPDRDFSSGFAIGNRVARFLLSADEPC
jgi:AcrR family transcriptional regulator